MNMKRSYTLILCIIFIFSYSIDVEKFVPIEELDIPIGIGYDLASDKSKDKIYDISLSIYNFGEGGQRFSSTVVKGKGSTIGQTREDRQRRSNRKFILGTEKIILISEDVASISIRDIINILFTNILVNDKAKAAIIKGKTFDGLNMKIEGYSSSSEFIEGLIENSTNYNFFSKSYKTLDIYSKMAAEGKSVVLPYIHINEGKPEVIGTAIFNKDKLAYVLNLKDSKAMNMLRENRVKGIITVKNSSGKYIDLYAHTDKKIECNKQGEKYNFNIDLKLTGEIVDNNIYDNLLNDDFIVKEIEEEAKKEVEKISYNFIKKMQEEMKVDVLQLGSVAAAKYGRHTGTDWNKVISDSDIKVNVKFNLVRIGRGKY